MKRWASVALALTLLVGCRDASGPEMPLYAPLFSHVAASTWTNTGPLSAGRHFLAAAAASLDGRVFASGGLGADGPLTLVEAYDPAVDTWTPVAPLLGDRFAHASVRGGDGLIYAIGGTTDGGATVATSVVAYDPTADSWTSMADMSVPRTGLAAAVAAGKIYVTGGMNLDGVEASGEVYNPITGLWSPIASMTTPRQLHAMATGPDGRIYAIGGANLETPFIMSVEVYDPEHDERGWTEVRPLPSGRYGLGAATAGDGHIYAFGGDAGGTEVEQTVFMYDVVANTWTSAPPMNQARYHFGATASPDGRIYAVAGLSKVSGNLNSAEWYLPGRVTTVTVSIDIKPGSSDNPINRKSRGKVPVAVLSSSTFDARTIDRSTVVFAGAPALSIGGGAEDVNGDGLPDVVFHFATQALDLPNGTTEACLTGQTTGGTSFQGCDAVRLVN